MFKRILVSLVVVIGCAMAFLVLESRRNDPVQVVNILLRAYDSSKGTFNDVSGDIKWDGFDSVGYKDLGNGDINVYFGDLQFEIRGSDYDNEKLMASLHTLGIELRKDKKTGAVTMFYLGKPANTFGRFKSEGPSKVY